MATRHSEVPIDSQVDTGQRVSFASDRSSESMRRCTYEARCGDDSRRSVNLAMNVEVGNCVGAVCAREGK